MAHELQLPMGVVNHADVGRLLLEVENADNYFRQATIQQPDQPAQLSQTSLLLRDVISLNKLDISQEADRSRLLQLLQAVRNKAPVLHMSFNVDPSPIFMERLMTWLRQNIHPFVLIQVGLLPNIGAGCVVRTTNKYFDFSLRQHFTDARPVLISKLRGAAVVAPTGEVTVPEAEVAAHG